MLASVFIGAGPAGTGALYWAAKNNCLPALLTRGVALIERGKSIGGTIGSYAINSDSLGATYLECLDSLSGLPEFASLGNDESVKELEAHRFGLPPLALVGEFVERMGSALAALLATSGSSSFEPNTTVTALRLQDRRRIVVETRIVDGKVRRVEARTVVVALGGRPILPCIRLGAGDGKPVQLPADRLVASDEFLKGSGQSRVAIRLGRSTSPRVLILGGSHSAFSVAWVLTHLIPGVQFGRRSIDILARSEPSVYYDSLDAAMADGYRASDEDVCPRTHKVNRLGGIRGDGRDIWRNVTRKPGTKTDERIVLNSAKDLSSVDVRHMIDASDLIVNALGYRSATIPIFDRHGERLSLSADRGGRFTDGSGRVLLDDGSALPNVFGAGLGSGFLPPASMGGEKTLRGQANSYWLYQNDIGELLYRGIMQAADD